jgi:hypothetical protein
MATVAGTATAFWTTTSDAEAAVASAGTIGPPSGVVGTPALSNVTVTWNAGSAASGLTLDGYYVTRTNGVVTVAACGSSPAALLPLSPRTCVDASVPNGTWTYVVRSALATWTAASAPSANVVVVGDPTSPTMTLSGTAATNSFFSFFSGSYRYYFRSNSVGGGSLRIVAAVTDLGSGPASATFPAIATAGWTHTAETVSVGTGAPPTISYTSSPFSWVQGATTPASRTVTGRDVVGNGVNATVIFRSDTSAPTGGAVRVNGVNGNATGTGSAQTNSTTGDVTINSFASYTEAQSTTQSGLASSVFVRETATISNGTCGAFGGATPLAGPAPITQTNLPTGCYRYRITGSDNVGNVANTMRVIRVDRSAPIGGSLTINGTAATNAGTSSRSTTSPITIARTNFTDPESGMGTSTLTRATATVANGACGAFGTAATVASGITSQAVSARTCYRYVLTGTNAFGLVAPTLTTTVIVGPYVTSVVTTNGGATVGRLEQGDSIAITYSDDMNPQSFCSTWSTSGDQSLAADSQVTLTLTNAATDRLTVAATGCTFNFGTLALGSNAYTSATMLFRGAGAARSTITWTAATRTLTLTLGAPSSAAAGTVASSALVYSPSTAQSAVGGLAMGGTFTTANIPQF